MKAKDQVRLSALRMLKAAIMNKGVEKGRDLDDAEVLQVVASLSKQRRDSIEQFTAAGRTDLVDKESAEMAVLDAFLPPPLRRGHRRRGGCGDRRNRRRVGEGHGQGDESRDAEARRQDRGRSRRERSRAPLAWGLTLPRRPGVARSAASAGAATMTSRVLGVVREQVLASIFGASDAMDAYNVAFRVPNLAPRSLRRGRDERRVRAHLHARARARGKPAAFRLGAQVVTALLVVTGILIAAGWLFAEPLVSLFAGGYGDVPGKLDLTVQLTRVMLPFLTFVALAAVSWGC